MGKPNIPSKNEEIKNHECEECTKPPKDKKLPKDHESQKRPYPQNWDDRWRSTNQEKNKGPKV